MNQLTENEYGFNCKKFNGYKPCKPFLLCRNCNEYIKFGKDILLISLKGLGSVLMVSSVLKPLSERYPDGKIIFLTSESAVPLLENNPYIDEVIGWNMDNLLYLSQIHFDIVINYDRSKRAAAFSSSLKAEQQFGFFLNLSGSITYENDSFSYLYELGLDDEKRFRENKKSMAQIMVESLGLEYKHEAYRIYLSKEQKSLEDEIVKKHHIIKENSIGFNTGCSPLMANRSFPKSISMQIIKLLLEKNKDVQILLLGGKDEEKLNQELAQLDNRVIDLTNIKNMEYGMLCEDISKVVLSGCSFGLHLGIALGKPCVAWFGPSCEQEVNLFFGGKKFKSDAKCSPCWQRECSKPVKCNQKIPVSEVVDALLAFF